MLKDKNKEVEKLSEYDYETVRKKISNKLH